MTDKSDQSNIPRPAGRYANSASLHSFLAFYEGLRLPFEGVPQGLWNPGGAAFLFPVITYLFPGLIGHDTGLLK